MIILRLMLSLLILSVIPACQTSQAQQKLNDDKAKRADLHYQLGLDAIHKGAIPKAFEELLLAEKINPEQPETLDAIAYAWRLRGNNKQAEAYYKRALKAGAGSATNNNYGSLLVDLGEYEAAVKQLKTALEDPRYRNQSLAFVNLGDAYIGLKNLDDAVASYRKAHMLAADWSYPQLKEAQAYVEFNRPNYAQALYETLLRNEPNNQQALAGLISLLKQEHEEALLRQYIESFIKNTSDKLQQAWAKDELILLNKQKR